MSISIKEFRPTIIFLVKFLVLYLAGNMAYGLFISSYTPAVDPVTRCISSHSSTVLSAGGMETSIKDHSTRASTLIVHDNRSVLSVYEGCNGLNMMIIFVAFVSAFGPFSKKMLWFIPMGVAIIYGLNVLRIIILFFVAIRMPDVMYYMHKYVLTAFLFGAIFLLWFWWVAKYGKPKAQQ
jgi:exosortase family protein XrtF